MHDGIDRARALAAVRGTVRTGRAKSIRLLAGLSLAEVATAVGVTTATVARWEAGSHMPKGDRAVRYREVLDALVSR